MDKVKLKIRVFGKLVDVLGSNEISIPFCPNLHSLKSELENKFPSIANIQFAISLNNKIYNENADLIEGDQIALLPPFSGG
ncbi:MAG: MoaD/ThiS family protein [Bacteroidetes bacterium]|nr:MoaD/ThiS family protein [Bacteroidota bacterium]